MRKYYIAVRPILLSVAEKKNGYKIQYIGGFYNYQGKRLAVLTDDVSTAKTFDTEGGAKDALRREWTKCENLNGYYSKILYKEHTPVRVELDEDDLEM